MTAKGFGIQDPRVSAVHFANAARAQLTNASTRHLHCGTGCILICHLEGSGEPDRHTLSTRSSRRRGSRAVATRRSPDASTASAMLAQTACAAGYQPHFWICSHFLALLANLIPMVVRNTNGVPEAPGRVSFRDRHAQHRGFALVRTLSHSLATARRRTALEVRTLSPA